MFWHQAESLIRPLVCVAHTCSCMVSLEVKYINLANAT